ncbi:BTB domain-containing protein [Aphelenchoides besseyi]|nr:BTB domain-containing protein [Aphelenchoides besseyi]
MEIAFDNEKYSDFTVKAGDQNFKVAKFMLRTQSEVFDAMFNHPMKEGQTNEMEIKACDPEMVKLMLMFLYSGRVENLDAVAEKLLPLAAQYQIKDLADVCVNAMGSSLNLKNIIERSYLSADYDHLTDFKNKVLDFVQANYSKVQQLDGWKAFTRDNGEMVAELLKKFARV